jgi:MATE family multidrug resistance protein
VSRSIASAPASWREELAATLRLAWPLVLSNLAANAITTTDVLMLGRLGAQPLAAAALAVNFYNLLLFTGVGLSVAIAPMIASALGRRVEAVRESRRSFRMGLWLVSLYALLGIGVLSLAEPIFLALGQDPVLAAAGGRFMGVLKWALLPTLLFFLFRTALASFGRTPITLVVTLGGVAVNALLNWMLIFGNLSAPALGMSGSALATLITNCLMAAGLALAVMRLPRLRLMHLFGQWWRPDWPRFGELLRLGAPIALTWAFEVSVFSCAVFLMGLIDATSVAAHVIALQIAAFAFMVPLGLSQAATVRVGYGHGAGDPAWVALAGKVSLAIALGFAILSALVIWLFPAQLAGLFLDSAEPASAAVLALAVRFLLVAAVFQIVDGAQVVGASMLRGLHDTRVPMFYAAFGYWAVGLASGAFLAFRTPLAGTGIWIGLALGLAVVSVLMLVRWSRRARLGLI